MKKPKPRIRQNIWGNWNAYLGTRKHMEFGTSEYDAKLWLLDQTQPKQTYGAQVNPETGERAPYGQMWCVNHVTGAWFLENERTPYTCSPASETYWST